MTQPFRKASSMLAALCAVSLGCWGCWTAQPAAAQDARPQPSPSGLAPDYVWITASATMLSAGLGGLFALRVHTLYDAALALPGVSPQRLVLKRQTETAEVRADCLFGAAIALATTTLILALFTEWQSPLPQRERARLELIPVAAPHGAQLVLQGAL